MPSPKIVYNPGTGNVTLTFTRGPKGFACTYEARVHDNLATSGIRERVFEANDMVIAFTMPHLRVDDDYDDWATFAAWALQGGQFSFFPDASLTTYHHCVSLDEGFLPAYVAPKAFSAAFKFLVVPDAYAPADTGVVLKAFYGVTS